MRTSSVPSQGWCSFCFHGKSARRDGLRLPGAHSRRHPTPPAGQGPGCRECHERRSLEVGSSPLILSLIIPPGDLQWRLRSPEPRHSPRDLLRSRGHSCVQGPSQEIHARSRGCPLGAQCRFATTTNAVTSAGPGCQDL